MMVPSEADTRVSWLYANAGPVIRWRLVRDFGYPTSGEEKQHLWNQLVSTNEVQRWLGYLGTGPIHHSSDTAWENAMAKMIEYGLRAGVPDLDKKALPYAEKMGTYRPRWVSMIVGCFLVAAGYHEHPAVRQWFLERLESLSATALRGETSFFLSPEEAQSVPKAWRDKPVFRSEFGSDDEGLTLPTIFYLYAMAHWPCSTAQEKKKIADVAAYLSLPAFQAIVAGYAWSSELNRCHAMGQIYLACLTNERKVLFLGLTAGFGQARRSEWFQSTLADLEQHRTSEGRYRFPADYLREKRNSYHLYQGSHMGLAESRSFAKWREIESTFRMLNIHRLMASV